MAGVVPRRRDSLGESRGLEGGRSISPKGGGGGGRRSRGSGGPGKDEVAEFTFLRYRWIRDGAWGRKYGHANGNEDGSYIHAVWVMQDRREGGAV